MSSEASSVYIDLTESVSQSDSESVERYGDNASESDQRASDCCVVISNSEDKR